MNARFQTPVRYGAITAVTAIIAMAASTPAYAADGGSGNVDVTNTETVQVYTSPTGEVQNQRIYEQLDLTGTGSVDLKNPVSTDNLRNLDGFAGVDVQDGQQITKTTVDGEKKYRSVSDYKGTLPLDVAVRYTLDGRTVKPGDIVGKSGKLGVQYTVKNVTGTPQTVTFDDGTGKMVTKTVDVPIPMVGTLTTVAPPNFTNVQSRAASMGGDGKGGTQLNFTMTLFPPIGSTTADFGYTADITKGVVPRAEISALPVNPIQSPTFSGGAASYKSGAQSGVDLTGGATEIDTNLLKLRDGASALLAGLIQLRDGAGQLNSGLTGDAVPGSQKLAKGANDLNDGLGQINSGAKKLAAGTGEAVSGSEQVSAGASKLSGGLNTADSGVGALSSGADQLLAGQKKLNKGLTTLYDAVASLPQSVQDQLKTDPDYQRLLGTLDTIVKGIGTPSDTTRSTLMGGLNLLKYGLRSPLGVASCDQTPDANPADDCGAADGTQIIGEKLAGGVATINAGLLPAALGAYDGLVATAGCTTRTGSNLFPLPPTSNLGLSHASPCYAATIAAYGYGAPAGVLPAPFADGGLAAQSKVASDQLAFITDALTNQEIPGLSAVQKGLFNANCNPNQTNPAAADYCGISQALQLVSAGIPTLVDTLTTTISNQLLAGIGKPTAGCNPDATLRCGSAALVAGDKQLVAGLNQLAAGLGLLDAGGSQLASGSDQLTSGLGQLDSGANQLADGTGTAAAGSQKLADGSDQLSSGLKDAASGSAKLEDGLVTAAGGAPKLVDGAQKLSDQGTKKLIAAGSTTAQSYGEQYATMTAGAERANTEDMAYGAPKDALGLMAYSYVINGDSGETNRNWVRGLGGLLVVGAGAGVFAWRRRLV